jgi:endonuclease-3
VPTVGRILAVLTRARGPVGPVRLEDPLACLIGTILAQATNDALAERAYRALRRRLPSWRRVLEAPRDEIEDAIRVSGLAAQKAGAIHAVLGHLAATRGRLSLADLRRPGLDVDAALAELSSIPGVGIKTAAITLMFGAGVSLCAVDTHVARVLRRLGVVPATAAPERAFRILRPLVPPGRGIELHLTLIRFGRATCQALRPRCWECPLERLCPYEGKTAEPQ